MNNKKNVILVALLIAGIYFGAPYIANHPEEFLPNSSHKHISVIKHPNTPNIKETIIPHKNYSQIIEQIKTWNALAPDLCEIGTYGKSSRGLNLYYIRLTNELNKTNKDKILAHFCIHSNEPLATSVGMSYIANLLHDYDDQVVRDILDQYEVYFVPVVCPDLFPNSRYIDGVDPNRDFKGPFDTNHQSTPCIEALSNFFLQHKFCAAFSGHTFGRLVLMPWGYSNTPCKDDRKYRDILGTVAQLNNYRLMRGCELYGNTIRGTEIDFYYMHGAFAILFEYGTHQHVPSIQDTTEEFNRTYKGFKYFLQHGNCLKSEVFTTTPKESERSEP